MTDAGDAERAERGGGAQAAPLSIQVPDGVAARNAGVQRHQARRDHGAAPICPGRVRIHCEHLAVTPKHIETMDLPLRPTKPSDSRAEGLKGDCVEFEAVPPATLRRLVEEVIEARVDPRMIGSACASQRSARKTFSDGSPLETGTPLRTRPKSTKPLAGRPVSGLAARSGAGGRGRVRRCPGGLSNKSIKSKRPT